MTYLLSTRPCSPSSSRVSKSNDDLTKEEGKGGEGGVSSYGNEDVSTPKNRRTVDEHKNCPCHKLLAVLLPHLGLLLVVVTVAKIC